MELTVTSLGGDRHRITIRGHDVVVDQPVQDGGQDAGPTPTDLFVASVASCVAHYARRALGRDGGGPSVCCHWTMSDTPPWRVSAIEVMVEVPPSTSDARLAAVQRAIAHCTVHNTLVSPPRVVINAALSRQASDAAA